MDPSTSIPQGENNPPQSSEQIPQSLGTEPITPKETFVPPVQIQDNSDVPSAPVAPQTPTTPNSPEPAKKSSPILIVAIILMLIAVLAAGGYLLWLKYFSGSGTTPTPTPIAIVTASPTPDPTVNWKTYTNTQAGILFKYPSEVFVYQSNPQQDAQFWSNKINVGAPLELGLDGIWLNMSFSNPGAVMTDFYNKIINLKVNESITQSAVTKLTNIKSGDVMGATYYQGIPPNFAGAPAYTYEAVWIKEGIVYRLSLSVLTEENLQKYKTTFDQMVSTFKFVEATQMASPASSPSATAKP